jgi:hypothetical protein
MKTIYYLFIIGVLMFASCVFNPDTPLQNDSPVCQNPSALQHARLSYPDSMLCTLHVADRNDSVLSLSVRTRAAPSFAGPTNSPSLSPWPGSYDFLSAGYGTKDLRLFYPGNSLGTYEGTLLIRDNAGAIDSFRFAIQKTFLDPFDSQSLFDRNWTDYNQADSTNIQFDDKALTFFFKAQTQSPSTLRSTGIRSNFRLQDSFTATVDVKLRDAMTEGFEIGFFVSSSPDTERWVGKKTGIFLSGANGRISLEYRSIDFQSNSRETAATSGKLGISRTDSTITYFFGDRDSVINPLDTISHYFPSNIPVYIHLKMTVVDQVKDRHCSWNDLTITKGMLTF